MVVQQVKPEETYPLRLNVLRKGFPPESVHFETDDLPEAFHLGVLMADQLICVGSFYPMHPPDPVRLFSIPTAVDVSIYQLRGMACDPVMQSRGAGSLLLRAGLDILKARKCNWVWCNARVKAFPFYQRLGFVEHGEVFFSFAVPHKIMLRSMDAH